MPPGRYAPPTTLTEEEAAAIAAEQAAAYGSDYAPAPPAEAAPATTPYGGAAPAPAPEAAYAPPTPAETPYGGAGATPYTPATPASAPAPVTSTAPEWQSISPQETQTGNQRTVPGMTAAPSDFYDDASRLPGAGGGRQWSSISPQDSGNGATNPYPVSPSDFRDTLKTPEAQAAQATRYSPADPQRQESRGWWTDSLGAYLGLDPKRKDADMANQLVTNLSDMIGDATGTTARTALIDLPARALGIYGKGMQLARDEVAPRVVQAVGNQLGTAWGLTEDIYGPLGNTLRQLQSTSDPAGRGIAENVLDPAGSAKDNLVGGIGARFGDFSDWLNTREQERDRLTDEFQDRVEGVTDRGESPGDAIGDFLGFPLPSLGFQEPQMPEVDPHNPSPSWLLSPRLTAMQLGADLGSFMRSGVDTALEGAAATSTVETAEQAANRKAQQARGAVIRSKLNGENPLETAGAVAGSLLNLPPMPNVSLRAMFGDGDAPTAEAAPPYAPADPSIPGKMGGISSNESDSAPLVIQPAGNPLFPTDMPWAKGDASEPATGSTGMVQTASGALKGKQEQAKVAAQAAKDWLAGQSLPDVSMPSFDLPFGERGSGRPEMYQPSSPPAPSVGERLVDAATTGATWLDDQFISAAEGREMDELARLAIRQINPTVANGGAPLTMRRASPASGVVIDPNALYMPPAPERSAAGRLMDAVGSTASDAATWIDDHYYSPAEEREDAKFDEYALQAMRQVAPDVQNGGAPLVVRRSPADSGVVIDPNAMYMPLPPEESLMQRAGGAVRNAAQGAGQWAREQAADVSLPGRSGDYVRPYIPGETMPNAGNGDAPFVVRRASPASGVVIDPNAMYMPEPPEPGVIDRVRQGASNASGRAGTWVGDLISDVTLPQVSLPGSGNDRPEMYQPPSPAANTGHTDISTLWSDDTTGPGGQQATTDPLETAFEAGSATRSATQPEGTAANEVNGVTWLQDENGGYVGLIDPATGEFVLLPPDASDEEKQSIVDGILSGSTKGSSAPGPATSTPTTTATDTSTSSGSGSNSSGGSSRSNGSTSSGNTGGSSGGSSRRSSGSRSTSSNDDDWDSAPLKLEDFLQDFDGDGTIGKRDRMMGKQAFEQAKAARTKKRRGKTTSRKGESQFPFSERRSALGQQIASDVANALGGKKG